jgi:Zn-dependent protease
VLYSLADLQTFLILLGGVLLAWAVHVGAQRLVQSRIPETKWLLQHRSGIAGFVDPFAAVAAILGPASAGWTPPVEWNSHRGSKRPLVILLLAGPLGNLLAGAGCLIGLRAWVGPTGTKGVLDVYGRVFLGDFVDFADAVGGTFLQRGLLLVGLIQLIVAVVSLIPLPPLEGGRLLFLFTPKTAGWQKAEYQLAERNIGLILVLVGLIRISSGIVPPFAYLADVVAHGLAVLFAGL